jgi:hypothetical protein
MAGRRQLHWNAKVGCPNTKGRTHFLPSSSHSTFPPHSTPSLIVNTHTTPRPLSLATPHMMSSQAKRPQTIHPTMLGWNKRSSSCRARHLVALDGVESCNECDSAEDEGQDNASSNDGVDQVLEGGGHSCLGGQGARHGSSNGHCQGSWQLD